jgi:uncharacterized protein
VAPAALPSTFLALVAGVAAYAILSLRTSGSIAPDWVAGISIDIGDLLGGYWAPASSPGYPSRFSGGGLAC